MAMHFVRVCVCASCGNRLINIFSDYSALLCWHYCVYEYRLHFGDDFLNGTRSAIELRNALNIHTNTQML